MQRGETIGNKKDNITVIYTPWSNLKKEGGMAAGQVGFKESKKVSMASFVTERTGRFPQTRPLTRPREQVKKIFVPSRENTIVNRLNKTKVEKFPDLAREKEDRVKELGRREKAAHNMRVSIVWIAQSRTPG